jgi:hypothetical protein
MSKAKNTYTLEAAELLLQNPPVPKYKLKCLDVKLLKELCDVRKLIAVSSGRRGKPLKPDYVEALYAFVRFTSIFKGEYCSHNTSMY